MNNLTLCESLPDVANMVFTTMFQLPLETTSLPAPVASPSLTSCVQILGDEPYVLVIEIPEALTAILTNRMLGVPVDDVSPEDLADMAGEVANMIGGNFKALFPTQSTLSLPIVIRGSSHEHLIPKSVPTFERTCRAGRFAFRITSRVPVDA